MISIRSGSPKAWFSLLLSHGLGKADCNRSAARGAVACSSPASSRRHTTGLPAIHRGWAHRKQRLTVGAITYCLWFFIDVNTKHVTGNFTGKESIQLFYCLGFLSYSDVPNLPWKCSWAEIKVNSKGMNTYYACQNNSCFSLHKPKQTNSLTYLSKRKWPFPF